MFGIEMIMGRWKFKSFMAEFQSVNCDKCVFVRREYVNRELFQKC